MSDDLLDRGVKKFLARNAPPPSTQLDESDREILQPLGGHLGQRKKRSQDVDRLLSLERRIQIPLKLKNTKEMHLSDQEIQKFCERISGSPLVRHERYSAIIVELKHYKQLKEHEGSSTTHSKKVHEAKEGLCKKILVITLEAKKAKIARFNEIKRAILKSGGTPDQMEEYLNLCKAEGLINDAQYTKLHKLVKEKGIQAACEQLNARFANEIQSVATKISNVASAVTNFSSSEKGASSKATGVSSSSSGKFAQIPTFAVMTSTPASQPSVPITLKEMTVLGTYIDYAVGGAKVTSVTIVARILETTAKMIREKELVKDKEHNQDFRKKDRLESKIRDVVQLFPGLHENEFQVAFTKLVDMPADSLKAIAANLLKDLHPEKARSEALIS